jgi:hypothetical protein
MNTRYKYSGSGKFTWAEPRVPLLLMNTKIKNNTFSTISLEEFLSKPHFRFFFHRAGYIKQTILINLYQH